MKKLRHKTVFRIVMAAAVVIAAANIGLFTFYRQTALAWGRGPLAAPLALILLSATTVFVWAKLHNRPEAKSWLWLKLAGNVIFIVSLAGLTIFRLDFMVLGIALALGLWAVVASRAFAAYRKETQRLSADAGTRERQGSEHAN